MSLPTLLEEISQLCPPGKGFKPHRLLLLMAALRIAKAAEDRSGRIFYSRPLTDEFAKLMHEYGEADDRNRPYAPFFHLRSSSFWRLVPVEGKEKALEATSRVGGPTELQSLVAYAELAGDMREVVRNGTQMDAVEAHLLDALALGNSSRRQDLYDVANRGDGSGVAESKEPFPTLDLSRIAPSAGNPFVAYLNSLQRLSGGNSNSLAEFQARSPHFASIHVPHPFVDTIATELRREGGRTVILAGHAGDGKSTIALDVYRRLTGRADGSPLPRDPAHREDLDGGITILKDLSEREKRRDKELWSEIAARTRRFLVVSNTGALLEFLKGQAAACKLDAVEMESRVLSALDSDTGCAELELGDQMMLVLNLARVDNLVITRAIFARMIAADRWAACVGRSCQENCPIWRNVELLQNRREPVLDRLFLAYRRMHEYGTRLTLRQLTEHLAYLVTSGLEEADLEQMRARGEKPLKAQYMFFNRFFGDDGKCDHAPALRMRAVQEVRRQGFGGRPCPTWERKLWLKLRGANFRLNVPECDAEFELLRGHGADGGNDSTPGLSPDQAREQVRRMLYFLYEFETGDQTFLQHYLNTPMLLQWHDWQGGAKLDVQDRCALEQRIFHVLQEHFTGVRLPEGTRSQDRRLYVTLSRRRGDIRQSAQVVVADVDWGHETTLELAPSKNAAGGGRVDLTLRGKGRLDGAELKLTLPFLDYMVMRHFGELGETLQAAYVERLERFKASVQELAKEDDGHALLVRLRVDHTFRRQTYTVSDGKLEVSDAL
jgi:hypothetical protein